LQGGILFLLKDLCTNLFLLLLGTEFKAPQLFSTYVNLAVGMVASEDFARAGRRCSAAGQSILPPHVHLKL